MGNTCGSSTDSLVNGKLDHATKTGVLNFSHLSLTPTSSAWILLIEKKLVSKLKTLDISDNLDLAEIPAEICLMTELKILHASRCGLRETCDLSRLSKLKTIHLEKNKLSNEKIRLLPLSLNTLKLGYNEGLTGIPAITRTLINLIELNMCSCRVASMSGIGFLVSLEVLNLDDNEIVELSMDSVKLVKLRSLSLKHNQLQKRGITYDGQSIPASFFTATQVCNIDLEGNKDITKADILAFEGVDLFLERRRKSKEKAFQGGVFTDLSLFGDEN